jgi:hypothetical protein
VVDVGSNMVDLGQGRAGQGEGGPGDVRRVSPGRRRSSFASSLLWSLLRAAFVTLALAHSSATYAPQELTDRRAGESQQV